MTEGMSYEQACRARETLLYETWLGQMAAGHLTEAGLMAIRARIMHTKEFEPTPDRELMFLQVNGAIAVMRGVDPHDMPGSEIPDDAAEIFETTAPDDASELEQPPGSP